eukprot:CAMPEP_0174843330 /NCGR_PEP_ID=MMETSP1114-20130205/10453_1 /TAXON_ID=312471 /ORGANISM="Neobodo designis, Strain CCAP 1951/1" /LENGTH=90 /DNA_ID=CAMNT_0016077547 /DNA_START=154 /DNA_END=423 /DNA_ORIENTATION=+
MSARTQHYPQHRNDTLQIHPSIADNRVPPFVADGTYTHELRGPINIQDADAAECNTINDALACGAAALAPRGDLQHDEVPIADHDNGREA